MKLLVCGGRNYNRVEMVFAALDALHKSQPVTLLINGAANGADRLALEWAKSIGIKYELHPAQWHDFNGSVFIKRNKAGKEYNAWAGFKRNQDMIDREPDLVVAFPGGAGTKDLVARARVAGIKTLHFGET